MSFTVALLVIRVHSDADHSIGKQNFLSQTQTPPADEIQMGRKEGAAALARGGEMPQVDGTEVDGDVKSESDEDCVQATKSS